MQKTKGKGGGKETVLKTEEGGSNGGSKPSTNATNTKKTQQKKAVQIPVHPPPGALSLLLPDRNPKSSRGANTNSPSPSPTNNNGAGGRRGSLYKKVTTLKSSQSGFQRSQQLHNPNLMDTHGSASSPRSPKDPFQDTASSFPSIERPVRKNNYVEVPPQFRKSPGLLKLFRERGKLATNSEYQAVLREETAQRQREEAAARDRAQLAAVREMRMSGGVSAVAAAAAAAAASSAASGFQRKRSDPLLGGLEYVTNFLAKAREKEKDNAQEKEKTASMEKEREKLRDRDERGERERTAQHFPAHSNFTAPADSNNSDVERDTPLLVCASGVRQLAAPFKPATPLTNLSLSLLDNKGRTGNGQGVGDGMGMGGGRGDKRGGGRMGRGGLGVGEGTFRSSLSRTQSANKRLSNDEPPVHHEELSRGFSSARNRQGGRETGRERSTSRRRGQRQQTEVPGDAQSTNGRTGIDSSHRAHSIAASGPGSEAQLTGGPPSRAVTIDAMTVDGESIGDAPLFPINVCCAESERGDATGRLLAKSLAACGGKTGGGVGGSPEDDDSPEAYAERQRRRQKMIKELTERINAREREKRRAEEAKRAKAKKRASSNQTMEKAEQDQSDPSPSSLNLSLLPSDSHTDSQRDHPTSPESPKTATHQRTNLATRLGALRSHEPPRSAALRMLTRLRRPPESVRRNSLEDLGERAEEGRRSRRRGRRRPLPLLGEQDGYRVRRTERCCLRMFKEFVDVRKEEEGEAEKMRGRRCTREAESDDDEGGVTGGPDEYDCLCVSDSEEMLIRNLQDDTLAHKYGLSMGCAGGLSGMGKDNKGSLTEEGSTAAFMFGATLQFFREELARVAERERGMAVLDPLGRQSVSPDAPTATSRSPPSLRQSPDRTPRQKNISSSLSASKGKERETSPRRRRKSVRVSSSVSPRGSPSLRSPNRKGSIKDLLSGPTSSSSPEKERLQQSAQQRRMSTQLQAAGEGGANNASARGKEKDKSAEPQVANLLAPKHLDVLMPLKYWPIMSTLNWRLCLISDVLYLLPRLDAALSSFRKDDPSNDRSFVCDFDLEGSCPYKRKEELAVNYDPTLVALSFIYAFIGAFLATTFLVTLREVSSGVWFWSFTAKAALALGCCCVWAMHFFGIGALELGNKSAILPDGTEASYPAHLVVYFNVPLTIASALMVTLCVFGAVWLLARRRVLEKMSFSKLRFLVATLLTGTGVVAMHYSGMMAMNGKFNMVYDVGLVAVSCVLAYVVSAVGLAILLFLPSVFWVQLLASFVIALAVCSVHYTGSLAVTYTYRPNVDWGAGRHSGMWTLIQASSVSDIVSVLALVLAVIDSVYWKQRIKAVYYFSDQLMRGQTREQLEKLKKDKQYQKAAVQDQNLHDVLHQALQELADRGIITTQMTPRNSSIMAQTHSPMNMAQLHETFAEVLRGILPPAEGGGTPFELDGGVEEEEFGEGPAETKKGQDERKVKYEPEENPPADQKKENGEDMAGEEEEDEGFNDLELQVPDDEDGAAASAHTPQPTGKGQQTLSVSFLHMGRR
uniref:MHYT domain-containing protein n=1 Tax=Chromera velia CCMP2878 TaxID=1169474 RepID=A0A0G4IBX5_9ALVE|eukprot:Cvel_12973.t1-p1 / transcript=Cvel_12973.t1 / gene=Cvel_12973 / organism=Chromera_velia_CCMP2878 / gene_product=Uncharacterized signaling protein PA3311, putative / transcript_product=Uncharacterized signaling protein PA3311, putative / location=Cvel_scaffold869:14840-29891(+) / protein_length=1538 / sequence_SO=supercontig / SO=protein_coding / is_pseudo=false